MEQPVTEQLVAVPPNRMLCWFVSNEEFEIDTPLRQFVAAHPNLVRHCTAIHAAIGSTALSAAPAGQQRSHR